MRALATHRATLLHRLRLGGIILLILFGGALLVLAVKWPFTREETTRYMEQISSSEVQMANFERLYFPQPGYIAQNVTISREPKPGAPPLVRIGKITCQTTWPALLTFTHRISRIDLENVQVYIPDHVPPPVRKHGEGKIKITVTELFANGTVLEVAPKHKGGKTTRFEFPELAVGNAARNKAMSFRTLLRNPNPPGDLRVSGSVGPLRLGKIGDTPISGTFQFRNADLSVYKIIAGTPSADGRFLGTVGRAQIIGRTEIPNFEVTRSGHSLGVTAEFHAVANGTKGDVSIPSVRAHFLETTVIAQGSIGGEPGKTVSLDLDSPDGRVQDLLRLFVKTDVPPLAGPLTLHAHVELPPTHRPFIRRVQLDGNFMISDADFTKSTTQEKVDELSARARGNKVKTKSRNLPAQVSEDLRGDVRLREGTAQVSRAVFAMPGAVARGSGTYDVVTEAIDLRGELAMRATLSKAAGGLKSILLKPLDPWFKKDGAGAVLPVRISGTYSHPVFHVSLFGRK